MKGLSRLRLGLNNLFGSSDFCILFENEGFLVFADMDLGNKSVTNDIVNVIKTLGSERPEMHSTKVIYRDSFGKFDAVIIDNNNQFQSFYSLNTDSLPEAMKKYDELFLNGELK